MSDNKTNDRGIVADKGDYKVIVKYSDDAIKNKLIKFETKSGDTFEMPVDQIIELVSHYVNGEDLAPMFVDTERIKVVYVTRQMSFTADRDIRKGEKFNTEYRHPYPLEFAIIEKGFNIAEVAPGSEGFVVTPELLKQVKRDELPEQKTFVEKFYKSLKNIVLGGST